MAEDCASSLRELTLGPPPLLVPIEANRPASTTSRRSTRWGLVQVEGGAGHVLRDMEVSASILEGGATRGTRRDGPCPAPAGASIRGVRARHARRSNRKP
ncbi:hypothetical protein BE17_27030 [Sorangium cellulosum]|uniref:Uncharacterized protein n=1 Tax=Sorangium cellulosum TaxID=56 RepID=A0A150SUI4_SORCE|nr:hypothetical protein BE17_27030 [Sorangium cellulosum]